MAISAPTQMQNNRGGNGRYVPMRRKRKGTNLDGATDPMDFINKKDARMRFKNSKDPIYVAFDFIDKQPVSQLAVDFVKDSVADVMSFVTQIKNIIVE